jgi:hypothetical protein
MFPSAETAEKILLLGFTRTAEMEIGKARKRKTAKTFRLKILVLFILFCRNLPIK